MSLQNSRKIKISNHFWIKADSKTEYKVRDTAKTLESLTMASNNFTRMEFLG